MTRARRGVASKHLNISKSKHLFRHFVRYANFFCLSVRTTILYLALEVALLFVSIDCITPAPLHAEQTNRPQFRLEVTDNPKLKRFDLKLLSLDDRTLCISIGDWPNEDGEVQGASQWVSIESAGRCTVHMIRP
jgi:hypothetical protein